MSIIYYKYKSQHSKVYYLCLSFTYRGSKGFGLVLIAFFMFSTLKFTLGFSCFLGMAERFGTGGRLPDTKHLWSDVFIGCPMPSPFFRKLSGGLSGVSAYPNVRLCFGIFISFSCFSNCDWYLLVEMNY